MKMQKEKLLKTQNYENSDKVNVLCGKAMIRAVWVLIFGFISIGFIGWLGIYHTSHPVKHPKIETIDEYHQSISKRLLSNIKGDKIKEYLRILTTEPHPAGTQANANVAHKIANLWKSFGLEDVHYIKYDVLLSYPDYDQPNRVYVIDQYGQIKYSSKGVSPVIIPDEQGDYGAGIQWIAYSANGTVQGDIVYCHYGRVQDFDKLKKFGIDLKGKIAMIRYGEGFRGDKIHEAIINGAIGAILFSDPKDIAKLGTRPGSVYPSTEWMPNEGVQRGTVMFGNGDPLSPLYPSKKDLYRTRDIEQAKEEGIIPTIPVLPLSYTDAYKILLNMDGRPAPSDWQGGINVTYRLGPSMKDDQKIRIKVHSTLQTRTIRNVIGYIHGSQYPDRYVILGNHFDAWVYGSIDPNSGTATLTEVIRSFMQTINETNWRPGRTLMFCGWDAEEYGLIGSTEFVEEFSNILQQRAVVYLNVDCITSNQSMDAATVPTLYQITTDVAKRIPNPMKEEISKGRATVYDTWIKTFPNEIRFRPDAPKLPIPGAGSDHAHFLNYIGVPVIDFRYRNASMDTYPLYHTLYETPFVNEHILDTNNLSVHSAVGQYWAELAREFCDSAILPLNITDYANMLINVYVKELKIAMEPLRSEFIAPARQQLSFLIKNCQEFLRRSQMFERVINNALQMFSLTPYDTSRISLINDRIMSVDRCFIIDRGIPDSPDQRHILFSINNKNSYSSRVMAPVYDKIDEFSESMSESDRKRIAREIAEQISIVQYSVQCATNVISDVP